LRAQLGSVQIRVACLTGSTREANAIRSAIAAGEVDVAVGTHALIQDSVDFSALGLVIVDEQHRFGVLQRHRLFKKGVKPDLLHMTATPIPRSLAKTVYGAMDLSLIEEMPPGRQPVKTERLTPAKLPKLFAHIANEAAEGRQTFVVCPLVEDSEIRDDASAVRRFEELRTGPLSELRLDLLHGRMRSEDKDAAIQRFKRGEIDVLVCTTVIEVGVDCPNASTIVIEDAGRFGLPQLHQLRGRVGRGNHQAYCYLLGKLGNKDAKRRLEVMCETNSGFDIAEADLELRGPGEFFGVRQAGLSDLRVADLVRDARLIDRARQDAQALLAHEHPESAARKAS
jgi:ATP-dependent DNA helicase RecG